MHEIHHLLRAIAEESDVAPYGATFEDGYRAAEVCDAIVRSGASGQRETSATADQDLVGSGRSPTPLVLP